MSGTINVISGLTNAINQVEPSYVNAQGIDANQYMVDLATLGPKDLDTTDKLFTESGSGPGKAMALLTGHPLLWTADFLKLEVRVLKNNYGMASGNQQFAPKIVKYPLAVDFQPNNATMSKLAEQRQLYPGMKHTGSGYVWQHGVELGFQREVPTGDEFNPQRRSLFSNTLISDPLRIVAEALARKHPERYRDAWVIANPQFFTDLSDNDQGLLMAGVKALFRSALVAHQSDEVEITESDESLGYITGVCIRQKQALIGKKVDNFLAKLFEYLSLGLNYRNKERAEALTHTFVQDKPLRDLENLAQLKELAGIISVNDIMTAGKESRLNDICDALGVPRFGWFDSLVSYESSETKWGGGGELYEEYRGAVYEKKFYERDIQSKAGIVHELIKRLVQHGIDHKGDFSAFQFYPERNALAVYRQAH